MIASSDPTENQYVSLNKALFIKALMDLLHNIESMWDTGRRLILFHELNDALLAAKNHKDASVRGLAILAEKLFSDMTLKQFLSVVVPVERVYRRGIVDHDILVQEGDLPAVDVNRLPLYVIADNIRSSFNVGSLFRTGDCIGVKEIFLTGYTSSPEDEKTKKTAMGSDKHMHWTWLPHAKEAIDILRRKNIPVVAVETFASEPSIHEFNFPMPCALLLGNEKYGLNPDVIQMCDHKVRIPLAGVKNSLNIGVALGVCGYEISRQWNLKLSEVRH
ncbi:MAG: TrmH family RNA methyltransferase [Oligoflexales bacterium]